MSSNENNQRKHPVRMKDLLHRGTALALALMMTISSGFTSTDVYAATDLSQYSSVAQETTEISDSEGTVVNISDDDEGDTVSIISGDDSAEEAEETTAEDDSVEETEELNALAEELTEENINIFADDEEETIQEINLAETILTSKYIVMSTIEQKFFLTTREKSCRINI